MGSFPIYEGFEMFQSDLCGKGCGQYRIAPYTVNSAGTGTERGFANGIGTAFIAEEGASAAKTLRLRGDIRSEDGGAGSCNGKYARPCVAIGIQEGMQIGADPKGCFGQEGGKTFSDRFSGVVKQWKRRNPKLYRVARPILAVIVLLLLWRWLFG